MSLKVFICDIELFLNEAADSIFWNMTPGFYLWY